MKNLQPCETELVGEWIFANGRMTGDEACDRIEYLTEKVLKEIGRDATGWDVLYQDPNDGRYWELTYPKSHMHGGGPPRLTCISAEQAKAKYGDVV
jgi:hypothetical protein